MKRLLLAGAALTLTACAPDTTGPSGSAAPIGHPSFTITPTGTCTFTTVGTVNTLDGDCTTSASILIPDGETLNGAGHTITAVDPTGGHFLGAVVTNSGYTANVKNLVVTASGLAIVCNAGADRLRGIMFDNASGSIIGNTIRGVNQAGSGCQEGNAIEVRNFSSSTVRLVEVANNTITDFMKTGIVVNGTVNGNVHNNNIGASANQLYLAANSIQFGWGATGIAKANQVAGNQWCTRTGDVATGILLFEADPDTWNPIAANVNVTQNIVTGNADVGIYVFGTGMTVNNNKVSDNNSIADCNMDLTDIGIWNDGGGSANFFTNNKVSGFKTAFFGLAETGTNKSRPVK